MNVSARRPLRRISDVPGPRGLPWIGSALEVSTTNAHVVFEDWCRKYGDVFSFQLGKRRGIGVALPDVVRDVMQARPDSFRRFGALEPIARELGFLGVFAAEGGDWRRQRRLMNPSFHAAHLDTFHDSIATVVERLLGEWQRDSVRDVPVDVLRDLMRFTVDVTSVVAFGRDLDTVRKGSEGVQSHLEVIFPTMGRRLVSPLPYWRVFPALDRGFDHALAEIRKLMLELVTSARRTLEASPERATKPRTLLESMLVARDDEEAKEPLSDAEVYANVITLLLAGEDTTANTLAWILHYLALHPDVAARARAEVDAVLGDSSVPTMAQARDLHYVEAIALEALRLRSPAPQLMLEAVRDVEVAGVSVPKGSGVMLMTRLIATNPAVFGDPTRFRPERWLDDAPADTKPHSPRLMLAFGAGPRVCPGRGLALLECAMLVGALVKRFDVIPACRESDVQEITTFTMQPRGIRVRFRRR